MLLLLQLYRYGRAIVVHHRPAVWYGTTIVSSLCVIITYGTVITIACIRILLILLHALQVQVHTFRHRCCCCCYYCFRGHGIVIRRTRCTCRTVSLMLLVVVDDGVPRVISIAYGRRFCCCDRVIIINISCSTSAASSAAVAVAHCRP